MPTFIDASNLSGGSITSDDGNVVATVTLGSTGSGAGWTREPPGFNGAVDDIFTNTKGDGDTLSFSFDGLVEDVSFDIFDVNSNNTVWDDKITIVALDADGNQVPVTFSGNNSASAVISGNEYDPTRTLQASPYPLNASNADTVTVSIAGPISFLSIQHSGGDSGADSGYVGLEGITLTDVCFTRDTMIDTDQGEVAVQDLTAGMMVRTRDNGFQPIRWVGMSPTRDRAVRIKAGALGNARDLVVSPRHRMVLDGWQLEMLFDHDHALVTALELVNDSTIVRDEMADVEYYHVMFDKHEIVYAEGAATESFHPDQPSMGSMDREACEEIFALFPDLRDGAKRDEAAPNLSAVQAAYVGKNLDAFVN